MKKIDLSLPIKTSIVEGQEYVDRPVYKRQPVFCAKEPVEHPVLTHHKRVPLRWMKPDGKGGLVPLNNRVSQS